jgi:hypothetical protein
MAPDLIYHDLLTVSYVDSRRAGIYWLRLFRDGDRYVAVITEVPGNPSFSVTNAISEITIHIMQEFEIRPDRLSAYQIHPRRTDYGETNVKRVSVGRYPSWEGSSRAEIEADLGIPLPELPAHEELYRQVLQRGGGTYRNIYRAIFEAVDPTELPPFYDPFKCKHFERLEP